MGRKKMSVFLLCIVLGSCLNASHCPSGLRSDDPDFCAQFQSIAICHCTAHWLPKWMCHDMEKLYRRMIFIYGTVEKACQNQKDTLPETCIDHWECYRNGGKNSLNQLCSGTGIACG